MAAIIDILIGAQNRTGPGIAGARANVASLGVATDRSAQRMQYLSDRVIFGERRLQNLGRALDQVTAKQGANSLAAANASLRYDQQARSIDRTRQELDRLHREQQETPRGAQTGGLISGIGGINGALGAFGLAVGAQQITAFGVDAIRASNQLQTTETTVRALAQTQERYNETIALARQQQRLFGGSMQESLAGLASLIPMSRNAGVALADLNLVSQQLAASSPEQGIQGAAFAVREFLSADDATALRSLAERFELPKQALQDIKAAGGDASEQIRQLTELMNRQGFTQETLAARTRATADSYTQLGVAWNNARDAAGSLLSRGLEPVAMGAAGAIGLVTDLLNLAAGKPTNFSGDLAQLYVGGNLAQGFTKEQAAERSRDALGTLGLDANAVNTIVPSAAPKTTAQQTQPAMAMASPSQGGSPMLNLPVAGTTIINNYTTVQGSIVTEQEMLQKVEAGQIQKDRRNVGLGMGRRSGMSSR